mmetsp:Transcript_13233/g.18322  ORF Transcript_13233/g.18322 Transcript_13233/m.18322 type:complete len:378 (+) Transcript_13233:474-1607(+)|eukprot:CAMPEP_0184489028 /NCGR_PEP_ID=MMETSP0113_2-20130426/14213_1 /TAXON_ID=91329 /ORGANISM="Norrisiella sphaerica, Strain BC52" /LENGTH=377 /DNA_ID=CAMNT_0026872211 /DNA_START=396 /DNA_END=1529 /DNA_ORIENTATION=-
MRAGVKWIMEAVLKNVWLIPMCISFITIGLLFQEYSFTNDLYAKVPSKPLSEKHWPFEFGFLDGPMSCDVYGSELNFFQNVKCLHEGSLRVLTQYPISDKFQFQRRMEFANTLLCNLLQCSVKEVHLLLEDSDMDFKAFFREEVSKILLYGNQNIADFVKKRLLGDIMEKKLVLTPLGARVKYLDMLRYVNQHPEWEGEPILFANGDISIGDGFDNKNTLSEMLSNNTAIVHRRYEAKRCEMYGEYFNGFTAPCDCDVPQVCYDSYLVTYPLPKQLESLGPNDGIDFYMGGLWSSENVFVRRLKQYGMNLVGTCQTMRVKHHHCSQERPNQLKNKDGKEMWIKNQRSLGITKGSDDGEENFFITLNEMLDKYDWWKS